MKLKELLQSILDEYIALELDRPGCLNDKFKAREQYTDDAILNRLVLGPDDDQEEPEEQMEGD